MEVLGRLGWRCLGRRCWRIRGIDWIILITSFFGTFFILHVFYISTVIKNGDHFLEIVLFPPKTQQPVCSLVLPVAK